MHMQPWSPYGGGSPMLASTADRERAVDILRAGFAEGRLAKAEFEERVTRAYSARTQGDLSALVADLPHGPIPTLPAPPAYAPAPVYPPRSYAAATNGKAVAALVLGILTMVSGGVTSVPAVVLGHMARGEIRRTGQEGDGCALAGLVLGWLWVAGWGLVWLFTVLDRLR
ncbi:DUF1707 and DUF4190 domain-containing protein [Streptomyces abyssomicinicus]|uniref:DUF1707 and DUF4190 domain-containing protein n=1 Tax=Streptomyces abyssomicinicus TaxID=574929 RepID=UPI001FEB8EB7|nr:DUF1707 and DUF4190 domain-containing protein [Streptomyces abyssomicinicus]